MPGGLGERTGMGANLISEPDGAQIAVLVVMNGPAVAAALAMLSFGSTACATLGTRLPAGPASTPRDSVIARAQVWSSTRVPAMNMRRGPGGPGAFAPEAVVTCDHVDVRLRGHSPKFACRTTGGEQVKVKYGAQNGEVYGEVLATRLLWALGFGADRMYVVNVICRGCPESLGGVARGKGERQFFPAVIERGMSGREWPEDGDSGWSWAELDSVTPAAKGAPRAHRDALKLLAVLMQHTDSKPEQQRILCLGSRRSTDTSCASPFLMVSDVGLTFGRANLTNSNSAGANLEGWRRTPVWKDTTGCTGNIRRSLTGTLDAPVISEAGRRFLTGLLRQLSDRQLTDLFAAAQVPHRLRTPGDASSGFPTVAEWVQVFKAKRDEIAGRRCSDIV
jgi:hypothetical protein